jgi:hypothetical protein
MSEDGLRTYLYQSQGPSGTRGRFSAAGDKEALAKIEAMGFGGAKLFASDGTEVFLKQHVSEAEDVHVESIPSDTEVLVPLPPGFTHPPRFNVPTKSPPLVMTTAGLPRTDLIERPRKHDIEEKDNFIYKRRLLWGDADSTAKSVNEILEKKNGKVENMNVIVDGKGKTQFFVVVAFEEKYDENE